MPRSDVLAFLRAQGLKGLLAAIAHGPDMFAVSKSAFRTRVSQIAPLSIFVFNAPYYKLQEMYLSKVADHLRWRKSMDSIFSRMLVSKDADITWTEKKSSI